MFEGILKRLKSTVSREAQAPMTREAPARVAYSPDQPKRLWEAVRYSYEKLSPVRVRHRQFVSEFTGDLYGDAGGKPKVLVNKINQMVSTYLYLLSSGTPQCLVSTKYSHLRPFAHELESVVNQRLREVRVEESLRECVMNAMFSVGVAKTGIADGDEMMEIEGEWYDPGTEFTVSVHPNNFVIDMQAESLEQVEYLGDRYLRPVSWLKGLKLRDKGAESRHELRPEDRAFGIDEAEDMRLEKKVWLWDVYMPKHGCMMTFVEGNSDPLVKWEWDGPEGGPYDVLQFSSVPGEVIGLPPVATLYHQHQALNNLLRKTLRQAERAKIVTVTAKGDEGDAETINRSNDGDTIALHNTEAAGERKFGGPDLANHNLAMYFHDIFDAQAGNLALLAGLSAQSGTARQDQLLHNAANLRVGAYQETVLKFFSRVMYRHAWYVWSMQIEEQVVEETVPGAPAPYNLIRSKFTPEEREGDFLEYNFSVNPHSLRRRTPMETSAQLMDMWVNVVLPSAEVAMQSGFAPNFEEFSKKIAELNDVPHDLLWTQLTPGQKIEMQAGLVAPPPRFRAKLAQSAGSAQQDTGLDTEAMMQANSAVMADNKARSER